MTKIQRIELAGTPYVLLPEDAYEELRDMAEARAVRSSIANGEETYPDTVVSALLDGENPVRVFRQWRGLKAVDLARAAGLAPTYLSEIETGRKTGSARALKAIAAELDVDMALLVSPTDDG
ncbi:MAG: helix-turn-helix transcriptional regulator [Roseitalea sp.]|nr:helix-turn-helix transcriptional regulator [Roseitalea sp.]MBO6723787.1 helix-turn-helix transcriptional regulator [Roseitalea sp.]MBO6741925.1 helix-turn-helix transcriptional regulator [Roseitalea sp.]